MKVLYFGGQKSGKTSAASKKALELSGSKKPYYVATYDNSYDDASMQTRIDKHLNERVNEFLTIEEPKDLVKIIEDGKTYLVDCVSMWLFNNLKEDEKVLKEHLQIICKTKANIVFVVNDVSCGVIPCDSESRRFVDFSGLIGQELVKLCDEVYEVKYSISKRLK